MNTGEAGSRAAAFLDADLTRYPGEVRNSHVNEAIHTLVRKYDIPVTKVSNNISFEKPADFATDAAWKRYPGSIDARTSLTDANFEFDYTLGVWVSPYKMANRLVPVDLEELYDEYGDDEGEIPEKYSVYAGRIFVRPAPALGDSFALRIMWAGKPSILEDSDTSPVLDFVPWGVIYRTCEVASGWLLEDQRIPAFTQARQEQMDSAGVAASMEHDTVSFEMREP